MKERKVKRKSSRSRQEKEAKQEFFVALQLEASAAKCRMDLVRHVAATVIVSLKDKADSAYKDMNDWLGARFLKEMESIDQMSEVMRFAIENGTKIHQELKIDQQDFFIDQDIKVLRSPSPQPRPDPIEKVDPETFTVEQIKNLYRQFSMTAPSGMMSLKTFQEILTDVTSLSHGTEQLPEAWLNLSPEKLESIAVNLSADGEYIDWHGCLLQLAQPWPIPTQAELLETLERFKGMDQSNSGYITREQYERVYLWFNKPSKPPTPEDLSEPLPYDRLANLKTAFFDIFADHSSEPARLDYVKMLLHFSIAPDPYDGFLRALSVASGTHMPRLSNKKITIKKPSRPSSEASLALSDGEGHGSVEPDRKFQDDIPEAATNAVVLHHGLNMRGDSHRFSVSADPEDAFSKERLSGIYQELGGEDLEPLPYSKLIEHPVLQDIVSMCNTYRIMPGQDTLDAQSLKTGD
ncbi:hypothetical protein LSH36_16g05047 [Paralvinella palmiformis]|uniref:SPEF2 C-terminal domain-containing protein n=1 Tax=Paralvinella palmiformis TaxID=53620 RepID=A0AAD9KB82_9ANNE|nr:hypothetical protein LSH36_16g05047 [Paralvinella palmiformis]